MKTMFVKDLMVPLAEYATVSEDASLADAIISLEKAQRAYDHTKYRHRAVLVLDHNQRVIGKVSQLDALKALEPRYTEIQGNVPGAAFRHFSQIFIKNIKDQYRLFDKPLDHICRKAEELKVKDFMQKMSEGECISEDATLDEAIHVLIMGQHQSLLVTRKHDIIGILRLTDVFAAVFQSLTLTCVLKK